MIDINEILKPTLVIRSKRKTMSLMIKANGDFVVRAPLKSKDSDIHRFIKEKSNWIIQKRTEQLNNKFEELNFNREEEIVLLGDSYKITLSNIKTYKLCEKEILLSNINPQKNLIIFLKKYAKTYIDERIKILSTNTGLKYSTFSISSARTCWGSCSYNNKLHFTYKLIMCPKDVIDYVILHELCHTNIKNHGAKFWLLVEKYCPNYKVYEKWLKKNRGLINVI